MKVGVTADMGISIKNDDDVTDDENGNADDVHADSINMKVGVTADMGISIDGGEEYREGVLTITEVNPNSKRKQMESKGLKNLDMKGKQNVKVMNNSGRRCKTGLLG